MTANWYIALQVMTVPRHPLVVSTRAPRNAVRWIASIAIHAILAAGLIALRNPHARTQIPALAAIELVDVEPEVAPTALQPPMALPDDPDPGGTGGRLVEPTPVRAPRHPVSPPTPERGDDVAAIVGEVRIDRDGAGAGNGTGLGWGDGSGDGGGVAGDLAPPPVPPPPPPPAPSPAPAIVSKARPPHLVFPSRQVARDEADLFVARLTIDDDGFVVGARLARGFGGKRDEDAMSAVWRFRYAPALDAAGRPIQAVVEQHFDVGR